MHINHVKVVLIQFCTYISLVKLRTPLNYRHCFMILNFKILSSPLLTSFLISCSLFCFFILFLNMLLTMLCFMILFYNLHHHYHECLQEDYIRITLDCVVASAQIAKEHGCKHFSVVTGQGTKKNSWFLFGRVKVIFYKSFSHCTCRFS